MTNIDDIIKILTTFGLSTVIVELVKWGLNSRTVKFDESKSMRQELRDEVKELKTDMKVVVDELDQWQNKYYLLLQKYNVLYTKYTILTMKIAEDKEIAKSLNIDIPPLAQELDGEVNDKH